MNDYYGNLGGTLSDVDIQRELKDGKIFIAPYDNDQLQPAGYNLTPTNFFYSTKKKKFLMVHKDEEETYVIIDKNDTVLVMTRESIAISPSLTGAFYSKVKIVSEGFGHVSTTLDPNWEGQLLISLNNPTNRKLKFSIEKNVYGKRIHNSFVTLELTYLNEPSLRFSDNPPGRLDILHNAVEKNISLLKRNKIDVLKELIEQLEGIQENNSIELLILKHLSESERQRWQEIQCIQDSKEYEEEYLSFLQNKRKNYLRLVKNDYDKNAIAAINILNEFIEKKQEYMPMRSRILMFLMGHWYYFLGIIIAIVLSGFLIQFGLISQEMDNKKELGVIGIVMVYIIIPIALKFMDNWKKI